MRIECSYDKFNNKARREFTENIIKEFQKSNKNEIIIINIGTDKCIGDSIAPIVGTLLQNKKLEFSVYGTLQSPMHALNLEKRTKEIYEKHPNAFVIGIDACLGKDDDIGKIMINDKPIRPGSAVGKQIEPVGDISIKAVVDSAEHAEFFTARNIRLSFIYDMAQLIAKTLIHTNKALKNNAYSFNEEIAAGF